VRHEFSPLQIVRGLTDLLVLIGAFHLAYQLRFDFSVPADARPDALNQLWFVVPLQYAALRAAGIHAFIWRYVGIADIHAFLNAAIWSAIPVAMLRVGLSPALQEWRVPLSVIVIDTILAFGGLLAVRVVRRVAYERRDKRRRRLYRMRKGNRLAVLLIGAGRTGMAAARVLRGHADLEVIGFVDDDPRKRHSVIQGVKVLGATADLPRLVAALRIDHVIITIAYTSRQEVRRIKETCDAIPVKVRIIPEMAEILEGRVEISGIRDIQIQDLLGREPVALDGEDIRGLLAGKTVLITGAGGSIGSELAAQVARFQPSSLLLVDRAEFALFTVDRRLRESWPDLVLKPLVADIGDEPRMQHILNRHQPKILLHAAAHKHVPMMEANPFEAVKNNVFATRLLGELAARSGVETFVLISTDKAVRPKSIMGAAKRVAELVVQDLDQRFPTRFVAVRFGNVIGSAGSVIPIFQEQIRKGGPVTVTHPEMMRYFMTIPEAAQLVLQAAAIGEGGEIFVLDMGEPVRILDLAKDTIKLSGLKPFEDIQIAFTGLRPGEKLFEELQTSDEHIAKTRHPKIFIGRINRYPAEHVQHALNRLRAIAEAADEEELYAFLGLLLPEADLSVASAQQAARETLRSRLPRRAAMAYAAQVRAANLAGNNI
jgi:FlaA1/EpsC-like NDP-sugar epimerase